jgi:hypothetical protein
MFGGLPKLFDRSFFIGYFLPASLLFSSISANLFVFGYIDAKFINFLSEKSTFGAALSIVVIWLFSILLMAFNRPLIRILEGYGDNNPARFLLPLQKAKFKANAEPYLQKLNSVLDARRRGVPETQEFDEFDVWKAASNYPDDLALVLPTRLGNVMRAYEVYSDLVYGIESIVVWPRLLMIMPESARERIRDGEALFHFAVNTALMSILSLAISCGLIGNLLYHSGPSGIASLISWSIIVVMALALFFGWFSWSWLLPETARLRGELVKSTFDLYRSTLAEALGFRLPTTEAEERVMWRLVSRRMMLRVSEDRLSNSSKILDEFRKKDVSTPSVGAPSEQKSGLNKQVETVGDAKDAKSTARIA